MPDLAVIITYCGEFPHLHYTLQSLQTELEGYVNFEVLAVENKGVSERGQSPQLGPGDPDYERALDQLTGDGKYTPWLRRLSYTKKLSHWAAKNYAVQQTEAPFLCFLDAHCLVPVGRFRSGFWSYVVNDKINGSGSLHFLISDFLRPNAFKKYRLLYDADGGLLHYENEFYTGADKAELPYIKHPCLSTCGMILRREYITDALEYWPDELGPYGGGENYYNFVMARMGYKVYLWPGPPIRHWHIPGVWSRDYMPTYREWARNIMIATYLVAGDSWLYNLCRHADRLPAGHPVGQLTSVELEVLENEILTNKALWQRRDRIESRAVMTIEDWAKQWTTKNENEPSDGITRNG